MARKIIKEPRIDPKIAASVKRFEDRQKTPRNGTKAVIPPIIDGSVYGPIRERLKRTRFVGSEGMEKVCRQVYDSCTNEVGMLTVKIEELRDKIKEAREGYFTQHFGKWQVGDEKERGMNLGALVHKQYLGDIDEAFKPLEPLKPDQVTYELVRKEAISSLNYRFTKSVGELDQQAIMDLNKESKEKLRDELVERVNALGKGKISRAYLISPTSLIQATIGLVQEETMAEQEDQELPFAMKYLGDE